ncbi:SRPBCC family protein [uncultured Demequina sp.]|uniref:SRPBCC family protein n=1 Tax=uncultured Demequina sp. TaxID=693499 RepID=UPI0025FD33D2|nr:SRPBCC family protein [uncultured Demequina sp.]
MSIKPVHVKREIMAEPEAVWRVITDLDNAPKVLTAIVRIERLEGDGYAPGVKWRETRRMFGREESEDMWVTEATAPRSTTVAAESRGTSYSTVFRCEPSSLGTTLHIDFSATTADAGLGQRIAMKVMGKAGMKAMEKALLQDLEDIAKAAEAAGRR